MGSLSRFPQPDKRPLDSRRIAFINQRTRTYGSPIRSAVVSSPSPKQGSQSSDRQYHNDGLHKQNGRDPIGQPSSGGKANMVRVSGSQYTSTVRLPSGHRQLGGRPALPAHIRSQRLDSPPPRVSAPAASLGADGYRPVRLPDVIKTTTIRKLASGSVRDGRRRLQPRLEQVSPAVHQRSFCSVRSSFSQNSSRTSNSGDNRSSMAQSSVLPGAPANDMRYSSAVTSLAQPDETSSRIPQTYIPPARGHNPSVRRLEAFREHLKDLGLSPTAVQLLSQSTKSSTARTYDSAWNKWLRWCREWCVDSANPTVTNVINFLADVLMHAESYSTVNTARSALANTFPSLHISTHPLIVRLLRSAVVRLPPSPRYSSTFNLSDVLDRLGSLWPESTRMNFENLTKKTAFLLACSAIMRSSDLARISSSSIQFSPGQKSVTFIVRQPKDATRDRPHRIVNLTCTDDPNTCAVCTLANYFARTFGLRRRYGDKDHLFVSYTEPFHPVGPQRLAKWLLYVLQVCGVDTTVYRAHSIRSAAATHLLNSGFSVDQVMRRANWRSRSVFSHYYDRSSVSSI